MDSSQVEAAWVAAGAEIRRGTKGNVLSAKFAGVPAASDLGRLCQEISSWTKLRSLDLSGHPIDDSLGLTVLKLLELQELYLVGTQISDELLARMNELPNLKIVDVTSTRVTAEGLARERKRQIRLRIIKRD